MELLRCVYQADSSLSVCSDGSSAGSNRLKSLDLNPDRSPSRREVKPCTGSSHEQTARGLGNYFGLRSWRRWRRRRREVLGRPAEKARGLPAVQAAEPRKTDSLS